MPEFNEARSPLTLDNVQQWARATYTSHFRALPRAGRLKWAELDEFHTGRPVWRSLGRSAHKRLLVIGGYAPGPDTNEDPVEQVLAHVHSDEAEVSFYRTVETEDGTVELQTCNSTSTVAFHAPFCDVGSDTGGSKAIHRVSALILYYFLAAGHVKELARNKSDPTMFTRNFKDACAWVENGGERPVVAPSRRSSGFIPSPPLSAIPARPKRSSTISLLASASQTISEDICSPPIKSPPIKRSATDSMSMNIKRERDEDANSRPKKHPRRTLSEQIIIPSNLNDTMKSPRTPPPERVHRALQLRIDSLKAENTSLKDECEQQKVHLAEAEAEREEMRRDLEDVKRRLANLEHEVAILTPKPGRARRSP